MLGFWDQQRGLRGRQKPEGITRTAIISAYPLSSWQNTTQRLIELRWQMMSLWTMVGQESIEAC